MEKDLRVRSEFEMEAYQKMEDVADTIWGDAFSCIHSGLEDYNDIDFRDVMKLISELYLWRWLDQIELMNEKNGSNVHIFPLSENGNRMRWHNFVDSRDCVEIYKQLIVPAMNNMNDGLLPDIDEHGGIWNRDRDDNGMPEYGIQLVEKILHGAKKYDVENCFFFLSAKCY